MSQPSPSAELVSGSGALRIGWLSTGRGPGSRRLLESTFDAIRQGSLPASIVYVFCTRDPGEAQGSDAFLARVEEFGIPSLSLSVRAYRDAHGSHDLAWRGAYNAKLLKLLEDRPVDILVLAGFLLVLDEDIVAAFPTLNIHPAAPGGPIGTWQQVIRTQIEDRATESGAMTQLASASVDRGPVASFCRFPIRGPALDPLWAAFERPAAPRSNEMVENTPLFFAIRAEGVRREVPLLIATLRAVAAGELRFENGRVLDAMGRERPGLDLTDHIESALTKSA